MTTFQLYEDYTPPPWSMRPKLHFYLEINRNGLPVGDMKINQVQTPRRPRKPCTSSARTQTYATSCSTTPASAGSTQYSSPKTPTSSSSTTWVVLTALLSTTPASRPASSTSLNPLTSSGLARVRGSTSSDARSWSSKYCGPHP